MRSRELKFKAWSNDLKGWIVEPILINQSGMVYVVRGNTLVDDHSAIPVQYTELKDKNGNEVYCGDILKHMEHLDDNRTQTVATMITPFFQGDWSIEADECEVIGNVYENPDLITSRPNTI